MNNVTLNPLAEFNDYAGHTLNVDLTRNVNLHSITLRGSMIVTVTGAVGDGVRQEDGPARIVRLLSLNHDGINYVDNVSGRDLYYYGRRCSYRVEEYAGLPAAAVVAGAYTVTFVITISFSPRWAANPFDLFIPAMPVKQQLKLFIDLEQGKTNAGSTAGSGALVSSGTDTVAISDFALEVIEETSTAGVLPAYIPVLSSAGTDQFTTATSKLRLDLNNSRRLAAQLFANRYGSEELSQDGINTVVLEASNVRKINAASFDYLKGRELDRFPAVPTTEVGALFLLHADNGRLGQALDPRSLGSNPRFTFDVDAPTANPGRISVLDVELMRRDPYTTGVKGS